MGGDPRYSRQEQSTPFLIAQVGLPAGEFRFQEPFPRIEVSTESGSDRVLLSRPRAARIAETRSLPLPVLTSHRTGLRCEL